MPSCLAPACVGPLRALLDYSNLFPAQEPQIPPLAENKITKDNAWDLNIIDYMPSLVETLSQDAHFNFQKTSVALHASAQVRRSYELS